jgi:hypothetical protein
MKKLFQFIMMILLLCGCHKENFDIYNLTKIDSWKTIDFKINYTIQVPEGFSGGVRPGFEGNSFYAYSRDKKIQLYSGYGYAPGVYDFGEKLGSPEPKSIQVITNLSTTVILDQIEYFKQDPETTGIFCYSKSDVSRGRLYWKDNGALRDGFDPMQIKYI